MKLVEIITSELKLDIEKSELKLESIIQNSDNIDEKIVGVKKAIKEYTDNVHNFRFWVDFVETRIIQPKDLQKEENE